MKKISTVLALFLAIAISAQSFKYGITGNIHRGSIVGVHDRSVGKYGGALGVFAEIPLVENDVFDSAWLFLVPQIEYSMQGENAEVNVDRFGVQKYHYDYAAMQVYLKWFFHKGNMRRDVFLFAGPRIEYMVRQKETVDPAYDVIHYKFNLDDEVNKFGYGVSVNYRISRTNTRCCCSIFVFESESGCACRNLVLDQYTVTILIDKNTTS